MQEQEPSPRINHLQSSLDPSLQQSAFYVGNPDHDHTYESAVPVLPPRPRMRIRPSLSQTEELRKAYIIDPHPTKEQREELGKRIGMCVTLPYQYQYLLYQLTQSHTALSLGATRVSQIGFKISEALQKSDWMMTLLLIRRPISIAMATQICLQTCCLPADFPENFRHSRNQLSRQDLLIRLSRDSYAGTSGHLALNVPMPLLRRGILLIIVSSRPIVQDARGQSLIN